jgi:ferredoxin-type protein NapH
MNPLKNLSVIRKLVQLATFVLFVYGSAIGAYYLADKLTHALPALSCAYDLNGSDICALIPIQHQMDHRLGPAITNDTGFIQGIMPTLITLGTFLFFFIFLNKAFCGWLCPLGTFQEWLHNLGQKLGLKRTESVNPKLVTGMRPVKWAMLGLLVFGFPLLTGLGYLNHDLGSPFCSICPSRILTTLANGNTEQLVVDSGSTTTMALSIIADFLFGLMIALSLTVRQPFCRICPMLALNAVFRKLGLLKLVKNASPRCGKCGLCAKACPMDITEIHTEMDKRDVTFEDCTLCGRCVEFCPDKDVLQLTYASFPVFKADPQYFKGRKKAQKEWEDANLKRWFSPPTKPAKKARETST